MGTLKTGNSLVNLVSRRLLNYQGIAKGVGGKGPRQKTSKLVKNCQKVFRHFSRRAKNVKNRQKNVKKFFDTFRQFSRGTFLPARGALKLVRNENSAQRGSFGPDIPADTVKNFGQALQILEK